MSKREQYIALRPGGLVIQADPDLIQIAFSNYTATFRGMPIVQAVGVLLPLLQRPCKLSTLVSEASTSSGGEAGIVKLALEILRNSNCLYETTNPNCHSLENVNAWSFFASLGLDPGVMRTQATPPIVFVCRADQSEWLERAAEQHELSAPIIAAAPGDSLIDIERSMREKIVALRPLILCWGFQYRSALSRLVNRIVAEARAEALFGCCEGTIGRVGPWVHAEGGACLECLIRRLAANGGNNEIGAESNYLNATQYQVQSRPISHPYFELSVGASFLLEAIRIICRLQPTTLSGIWEYSFLNPQTVRRVILRVPGCPICSRSVPERLPWNAILPELQVEAAVRTVSTSTEQEI